MGGWWGGQGVPSSLDACRAAAASAAAATTAAAWMAPPTLASPQIEHCVARLGVSRVHLHRPTDPPRLSRRKTTLALGAACVWRGVASGLPCCCCGGREPQTRLCVSALLLHSFGASGRRNGTSPHTSSQIRPTGVKVKLRAQPVVPGCEQGRQQQARSSPRLVSLCRGAVAACSKARPCASLAPAERRSMHGAPPRCKFSPRAREHNTQQHACRQTGQGGHCSMPCSCGCCVPAPMALVLGGRHRGLACYAPRSVTVVQSDGPTRGRCEVCHLRGGRRVGTRRANGLRRRAAVGVRCWLAGHRVCGRLEPLEPHSSKSSLRRKTYEGVGMPAPAAARPTHATFALLLLAGTRRRLPGCLPRASFRTHHALALTLALSSRWPCLPSWAACDECQHSPRIPNSPPLPSPLPCCYFSAAQSLFR